MRSRIGLTCVFQSTLSMRRATYYSPSSIATTYISIHALHEESDHHFHAEIHAARHISIHALHEESDLLDVDGNKEEDISIHALHEESDRQSRQRRNRRHYFNPRSP